MQIQKSYFHNKPKRMSFYPLFYLGYCLSLEKNITYSCSTSRFFLGTHVNENRHSEVRHVYGFTTS